MIELAAREGVRLFSAKRVHEFVFGETLFDMQAFATEEYGIAERAAEKPI